VACASLSTAELRVILDTMTTRTIDGINGLKAAVGEHLGYSPWLEITQERVNQFAEATGDFQWIHVDVERAKAESPFGGPIAHGYLTLSLLPSLMPKVVQTSGFSMGVNYGCNRVRFMSPVPVGANLRLGLKLLSVDDIAGGAQMVYEATFEVEGSEKPSCVAEVVLRSYV
jgi:acyl dehydratase